MANVNDELCIERLMLEGVQREVALAIRKRLETEAAVIIDEAVASLTKTLEVSIKSFVNEERIGRIVEVLVRDARG